jgi:hypothetical protein
LYHAVTPPSVPTGHRPVCPLDTAQSCPPSHRGAPPCPAMMAEGRRCRRRRRCLLLPLQDGCRHARGPPKPAGSAGIGQRNHSSPTPHSDGGFEPPISLRTTPRPPRKGRAAVQHGVPRPTQRRAPPRAKTDAETARAARGSARRPFASAERLPRPTASTSLTARRAGRGEGWRPATGPPLARAIAGPRYLGDAGARIT